LYTLPQGPYVADIVNDTVILRTTIKMGKSYQTGYGIGYANRESENAITIDYNHPLAGDDLVFDITIEKIEPKK
jgi:FKBP-type peptidyl-prolyl cis-trans isomerase 2